MYREVSCYIPCYCNSADTRMLIVSSTNSTLIISLSVSPRTPDVQSCYRAFCSGTNTVLGLLMLELLSVIYSNP